jgi:hypothetical protein
VATKNLISDPSGTISLVPGYYYVNVSLTKGEDTVGFSQEALHIYTTVTSALPPKTYADSDFFEPEVVDDLSLDYWAFFIPEAGAEPWVFLTPTSTRET